MTNHYANPGVRAVMLDRVAGGLISPGVPDHVAVEEPLQIQIGFSNGERRMRTVAITMRTPGNDRELAAGFVFAEGIVSKREEIAAVLTHGNGARVELAPTIEVNWKLLERSSYVSSSCGVCGKTSLEGLGDAHIRAEEGCIVTAALVAELPGRLSKLQPLFGSTGGLHAAALFDGSGEFVGLAEDVGRHNALDKLIGEQFLRGTLPLSNCVLVLSGRASFELIHKAARAGIPVILAVGAPSSLAIQTATEVGLTLAGFVRNGRFNIYSGAHRITEAL